MPADRPPDRPAPTPRRRRPELDALRGIAVGLMVVWHVTDGWLAPTWRDGIAWHATRVAGGLAAPLFLAVAGAAVAIARRRGRPVIAIARRGGSVVALGGLLRMQLWLIDAGGLLEPRGLPAALAGLAGYGLLLVALRRERVRRDELAGAFALLAIFVWRVHVDVPDHAARILAVDVLHCIGAAIAIVAVVERAGAAALVGLGALAIVGGASVPAPHGPPWLTAWLVAGDGANGHALFPLLPWVGYALLGAAATRAPRLPAIVVGTIGAAVALLCFEGGLPATRRLLHELPALRPVLRLGFHAGALALLAAAALGARRWTSLVALGRVSLPVYWLHLEIAYGLLGLPFARAIGPTGCAAAALAILVLAARLASTRRAATGVLHTPTRSGAARASAPNSRA